MSWNLVTFADENFYDRQNLLGGYAKQRCKMNIHPYTWEDIQKTDFYKENEGIFEESIGKGYFIWKPYIILETMNKLDDGDIIMYCDTNDMFHPQLLEAVQVMMGDDECLLMLGGFPNKNWTKRDCFVYMNCDTEDYWDVTQLEAGVCFWEVCDKSKQVVKEWLEYCTDRRILTDDPNVSGEENFKGFQEHRRDQSILTNLAVKHELSVVGSEIRQYIECNYDYWYERNSKNGFTLNRPIDLLLKQMEKDLVKFVKDVDA
jgi:hypothetical protein